MNRLTPLLFLLFVLIGAGCAVGTDVDRSPDIDVLQDLSEQLDADITQRQADVQVIEVDEVVCTYEGQELAAGESYDDGCNTHTCQEDGEVLSTERACEDDGELVDEAQEEESTSELVEDEDDSEEEQESDGSGILEVSMEAGNFFFSPDVIAAEPGQEIELTFESNSGTHTFVIDEIGFSTGVSVNKTVTFIAPTDPGSYAYYCDVGSHRALGMEGTLIVQ